MIVTTYQRLGEQTPLHGFVNKSEYEILRYSYIAKGDGHCLLAVSCLSRSDFPQQRAQLRFQVNPEKLAVPRNSYYHLT